MKAVLALLALLLWVALLALLLWIAFSGPAEGWNTNDMTYVNNVSSVGITTTITYDFYGDPKFKNRQIDSGKYDSDVYSGHNCNNAQSTTPVDIEIWVDGAPNHKKTSVPCDRTIVAYDSTVNPGGVDIDKSIYGTLNQIDGSVIITIYPCSSKLK